VRVAKGFAGTGCVYSTRSVAKDDIAFGVSDVDMVVIGDWPEEEQIRLMRRLGTLAALSPLYDSGLWQQVHNRASFRNLWETDYFFQSRFDEGLREWKLEYGTDIAASLPAVPEERKGGGYYMEVRSWWLHFIASAFGAGPTARDPIFRNSIAYKAVTEILEMGHVLNAGSPSRLRRDALRASIQRSAGSERDFLERLAESARKNHLSFRGDVQAESLDLLLAALDQIHTRLIQLSCFRSVGEFTVDADPEEVLRVPESIAYARGLIQQTAAHWPAYRAAYLAPSASCFAMDDLLLFIELDAAAALPGFHQLREICEVHARGRAQLPQRIALYLLLPAGAVQLEFVNFTEMWRVLMFPPSSPDVFTLIEQQEFVIDGAPYKANVTPVWSKFAYDVALEELNVRRSVLSKVSPDVLPSPIEILRNVWRHLQLEALLRTADRGATRFPLSPAAVRRQLATLELSDDRLLSTLEEAYQNEIKGRTSNVRSKIPAIVSYLKNFC
jgi:predicted nucleotidyltransferase